MRETTLVNFTRKNYFVKLFFVKAGIFWWHKTLLETAPMLAPPCDLLQIADIPFWNTDMTVMSSQTSEQALTNIGGIICEFYLSIKLKHIFFWPIFGHTAWLEPRSHPVPREKLDCWGLLPWLESSTHTECNDVNFSVGITNTQILGTQLWGRTS